MRGPAAEQFITKTDFPAPKAWCDWIDQSVIHGCVLSSFMRRTHGNGCAGREVERDLARKCRVMKELEREDVGAIVERADGASAEDSAHAPMERRVTLDARCLVSAWSSATLNVSSPGGPRRL